LDLPEHHSGRCYGNAGSGVGRPGTLRGDVARTNAESIRGTPLQAPE
jgi:hypothetical protein